MGTLNISVLGPLEVVRDGEPVHTFASKKVQALLAYLVIEADRPHARGELATLLWPDVPEDSARKSLRHALWNLRDAIGDKEAEPPYVVVSRDTIRFDSQREYQLDAAFLAVAPPALPLDAAMLEHLDANLARARAPLLAGLALSDSEPFEEWLLLKREFYAQRVSAYYARLTDHLAQTGDYGATLVHARRWLELDPWREAAHQQIMRALALQGDRAQAMAQFERCRQILSEELGVEPSDATVALAEEIRRGTLAPRAGDSAVPFGAKATSAFVPHQVPRLLTPTVGRGQELIDLAQLFATSGCRLVTIVGPGGMGKTHLAQEFAARHETRYRDGAAMVALAGVQATDGLAAAVAHALGLPVDEHAPIDRQVLDYLAPRHMLLVLDNCEHLPAAVSFVEDWLAGAPDLVVLATSRLRLQARGEQLFPLGGLAVQAQPHGVSETDGNTGDDAATFFLQCAQRVRPRRRLDDDHPDLEHVRRICRLVDGMPLALMLAASWSASLSFQEIADELAHGLELLQSDDRTLAPRHQSIAGVFAQAWTMLSSDEQRVLARLAVFRGGFTRAAAATVVGASLAQLRGLTSKFLLSRSTDGRSPDQGRFGMHELLRQFSQDKLSTATDDAVEAHARHAAFYVRFLEQRNSDIKGPRQLEAVRELDAEIENITAAWFWVCANDVSMLSPAAVDGLGSFYAWQGRYREGEQAMHICLESIAPQPTQAIPVESVRLFATASRWKAHFSGQLGLRESAALTLALGLAHVNSLPGQVNPGGNLPTVATNDTSTDGPQQSLRHTVQDSDLRTMRAVLLSEQGSQIQNNEDRTAHLTEAVTLLRGTPSLWELADALCRLGSSLASRPGTATVGRAALDESRQLFEKLEDRWSHCEVLRHISFSAMLRGDHERGEATARQALAIAHELGSIIWRARSMRILGYVLLFAGKFEEALTHAYAALDIGHAIGARSLALSDEALIGNIQLYLGRHDEALHSLQTALAGGLEGSSDTASHLIWRRADIYLAQGKLDEAARDLRLSEKMHRQAGWTGRLHDVLTSVGYLAFALGDGQLLRASLAECAGAAGPDRLWLTATRSIVLAALAALAEGRPERAVELYALAETQRHVVASAFYAQVAGRHVRAASTQLAPGVVATAKQRGRQLDRWATVEAIAREYAGALPSGTTAKP